MNQIDELKKQIKRLKTELKKAKKKENKIQVSGWSGNSNTFPEKFILEIKVKEIKNSEKKK